MKTILGALAAATLLAGLAVPASAEAVDDTVTIPSAEYVRLLRAQRAKEMWRRQVERQIEYDSTRLRIGTDAWWQQMDREQRGGRR